MISTPHSESDLLAALEAESQQLSTVKVPVITVSATYRKELIKHYRVHPKIHREAVFSRAHYSMAEAVKQQAEDLGLTSQMSDPTNFVSIDDWSKIEFTQFVGKEMARHSLLKWIKDKIDTIARNKLPISEAITPPLLLLTQHTTKPIISMHYEAGNILHRHHHRLIQVVTDPHVRPQYLDCLPLVNQLTSESADRQKHQAYSPIHRLPDIRFAVFDTKTKSTFLKLAKTLHKHIDPDRIVVTGPPVDPRITNLAKNKPLITKDQPVNIGITTGGLGTNLPEIKTALTQLAPLLEPPEKIRLFLYAGTHQDFRSFFEDFAAGHDIRIGNLDDQDARIRILYEDSVIDANNNLINYLFPWAQVIITKPSGDMAYDAAAAGCALLFLQPWGEWEENIQSIFIKNRVGRDLNVPKTFDQLSYLIHSQSLQNAQTAAKNLPSIFREGAKNIVNLQQRII